MEGEREEGLGRPEAFREQRARTREERTSGPLGKRRDSWRGGGEIQAAPEGRFVPQKGRPGHAVLTAAPVGTLRRPRDGGRWPATEAVVGVLEERAAEIVGKGTSKGSRNQRGPN